MHMGDKGSLPESPPPTLKPHKHSRNTAHHTRGVFNFTGEGISSLLLLKDGRGHRFEDRHWTALGLQARRYVFVGTFFMAFARL